MYHDDGLRCLGGAIRHSGGGNRAPNKCLIKLQMISAPNKKKWYFYAMIIEPNSDEYFMQQALKEAKKAYEKDEVPVGAVVVVNNVIIARGHNQVELLNDPTAHAEMIAITSACAELGAKYLTTATLYVTLEPCLMCTGAIYWGKLARIVYGASDEKIGYKKLVNTENPFHPKATITHGILVDDCAQLLKDFFASKR
jgi:tRNA(adenine34) deaminase